MTSPAVWLGIAAGLLILPVLLRYSFRCRVCGVRPIEGKHMCRTCLAIRRVMES